GEYDLEIDDAPSSPNQKQANWALIAPLIPMFKEQLVTNVPLLIELLKYSPLPSRLVAALEAVLSQPPSPDAQRDKEIAIADKVATINQKQSMAEFNNAKAGATQ